MFEQRLPFLDVGVQTLPLVSFHSSVSFNVGEKDLQVRMVEVNRACASALCLAGKKLIEHKDEANQCNMQHLACWCESRMLLVGLRWR
jgi:hypothetical protein